MSAVLIDRDRHAELLSLEEQCALAVEKLAAAYLELHRLRRENARLAQALESTTHA